MSENTAYAITDVEADFIEIHDLPERLDEKCRCAWCGQWREGGWNLFYFNHTICPSCIQRSSTSHTYWVMEKTCDVCRKTAYCFESTPGASSNLWYICRNDLIEAAKHYHRYEPKQTFYNVADQYLAYLKQF